MLCDSFWKQKVCCSNCRFFAFCLMTRKLTGKEFDYYEIETLQFFTFTWFKFKPLSQHLHLFLLVRNLDSLTRINFKYLQMTSFSDFCKWDKNYSYNTCIMQNMFWLFSPQGVHNNQYKKGLKFEAKCFIIWWKIYVNI